MLPASDNFYLAKPEPYRGCLLSLRSIILKTDPAIAETVKYGMPCFCYINKAFCYLWTDKKTQEPYILFVEGRYLKYPQLEAGNRARMKILRINPNKDIPIDIVKMILRDAIGLFKRGVIKM